MKTIKNLMRRMVKMTLRRSESAVIISKETSAKCESKEAVR